MSLTFAILCGLLAVAYGAYTGREVLAKACSRRST
jgi:hypothetical protein